MHLHQDGGGDAQRNGGEQLIGNAEQRPQRVDSAQRIANTLIEKVSPGQHYRRACADHAGHPSRAPERLVQVPQQVLQHKAAHTRAGVDNREDEQSLEHDCEVIPESEDCLSAAPARENVRHSQRQ